MEGNEALKLGLEGCEDLVEYRVDIFVFFSWALVNGNMRRRLFVMEGDGSGRCGGRDGHRWVVSMPAWRIDMALDSLCFSTLFVRGRPQTCD